jgi:CheY-like chemotaxis protein
VALTGYGEASHRRLSREAGFDQHVTKPVDIRKLETLLKLPN